MPNPPFSGAGNDLELPIDPSAYVTDIEGNFEKLRTEVNDLHNRASASASGVAGLFGNGQLELNGDFQDQRWLHLKALLYLESGDLARVATSNYSNLPTGATLGYSGTTYTYQPTVAAGWYVASEMLNVGKPFGQWDAAQDYRYLKLEFVAAARTEDIANEDWPALYQPVSAHCPPSRFAGRALTMSMVYDCSINNPGKMYVAWDGGVNGRVVIESSTDLAAGADQTAALTATPDADATYLEMGIKFTNSAAFDFVAKKIYLSDNSRKADDAGIQFHEAVRSLVQRYYVQTWEFIHDQVVRDSGINASFWTPFSAALQVGVSIPMPMQAAFLDPQYNEGHPTGQASIYAHEYIIESVSNMALGSLVKFDRVADSVQAFSHTQYVEVNTGAPAIAVDGRDNVGTLGCYAQCRYAHSAAMEADGLITPVAMIGWGEIIAMYPPLFG